MKMKKKEKWQWKALGWLGALLVVVGYYLNANQCTFSWLIWIGGNTCIGWYSIHKNAIPTAVMSFLIAMLNIYGYLKWA
jgi:hypothetical protein